MIHYLIIGHACDEESEGLTLKFREEKTVAFLEEKFIESTRKLWEYDSDKEIYVVYILKSNSPIQVQYG